jgi:hypothetical protein
VTRPWGGRGERRADPSRLGGSVRSWLELLGYLDVKVNASKDRTVMYVTAPEYEDSLQYHAGTPWVVYSLSDERLETPMSDQGFSHRFQVDTSGPPSE